MLQISAGLHFYAIPISATRWCSDLLLYLFNQASRWKTKENWSYSGRFFRTLEKKVIHSSEFRINKSKFQLIATNQMNKCILFPCYLKAEGGRHRLFNSLTFNTSRQTCWQNAAPWWMLMSFAISIKILKTPVWAHHDFKCIFRVSFLFSSFKLTSHKWGRINRK